MHKITVTFMVNGQIVTLEVSPKERLIDTLREQLTLTGTKEDAALANVEPVRLSLMVRQFVPV